MVNRIKAAVRLPIDSPLRVATQNGSTLRGIKFSANLGVVPSPIRRPFTAWVSTVFPWVTPSAVGPDAIKPKFGVAINDYSPSYHRAAQIDPVPVIPRTFVGKAKGMQRVSGKSVPYPFAQPRYPQLKPNR